jgi:hypothetical protein
MRRVLDSSSFHFIALAFCGLVLVLSITSAYGAGVSTDAVSYISAADHLAKGQGLVGYQGEPFVVFGPLYPMLLTIPRFLLGVKPVNSGRYLNALAFAGVIFLTGLLFRRLMPRRKLWAYCGALAVLFSPGLIAISANILSDPVFIVLHLLFFFFFVRYTDRRDWTSFLLLLGFSALAALTRYVGAALILTGCLAILWLHRHRMTRGVLLALLFGSLAVLPLAIWIDVNYVRTHTPWGAWNPASSVPLTNLADAFLKMIRWLLPVPSLLWGVLVLALLVVGALLLARSSGPEWKERFLADTHPSFIMPAMFVPIYLLTIIFLADTPGHTYLMYDDRYYLPLYVPLLLITFLLMQTFARPFLKARYPDRESRILVGLFALWSLVPLSATIWLASQSLAQRGIIYYNLYNTPQFRESDVTHWLDSGLVAEGGTIYSNYPAAVYLAARRTAVLSPVNADIFGKPLPLRGYAGVWPESFPAWLVWYTPNDKLNIYPMEDLLTLVTPEQLRRSYYGSVYRLWPSKPKGPS